MDHVIDPLSELLGRGADPNAEVADPEAYRSGTTTWALLLESMIHTYNGYLYVKGGTVTSEISWKLEDAKAWSKAVKDFLDYGADIQQICSLKLSQYEPPDRRDCLRANVVGNLKRTAVIIHIQVTAS